MADRVVSYDFRGKFTNLTAGLTAAGKSVDDFGKKLTAADKNGAKMRAGLTTVGNAAGKVGLVAAAGLGAAVLASANFDKAMSKVQAATHETAANMDLLRAAAIKAGADTAFSAGEAAAAIEELAKAGVDTKDILAGGLSGALDLAAAGSLDVADAAEIAASALNQFQLNGSDVPHVADLLAASAGKAAGEVSDYGAALNQAGLVSAQFGLSIEETLGTLAAMGSTGFVGSDAGTSLKTFLQALVPNSEKAASAMDSMGFSAFDAQGKFVGMASVAQQLSDGLSKMSQEEQNATLKTIFGADAVRAAGLIYQQGGKGIQSWIDKTNDAGYAAETAATKLDNLSGDLEALKGSFETLLIGAGDGSQGPLRKIVQGATEGVNALSAIPGPAKSAATGLLAITAVLGGGLWFSAKVVSGVASMNSALLTLGITAETTRAKMALVGTGTAAAAIGIGTFVDTISQMDSISRSNAAADATAKSFQDLADALSFSNVGKNADALHINLNRLADDLFANGEKGEYATKVMDQLAESSHGFGALVNAEASHIIPGWTGSAEKAYDAHKDLAAIIANNRDLLGQSAGATDGAAGATRGLAAVTQVTTGLIEDETKSIEDNIDAMRRKREATLAAFDAETAYRQALKGAREAGKKNNAGINGNTDAALENRAALSGLASAWNGQSEAVKNNVGKFHEARDAFVQTAVAMGVPKKAAHDLARQLLEIPRSVVIRTEARTQAALAALNTLADFQFRDKYINVHTRNTGGAGAVPGGTYMPAAGGLITGPGGPRDDAIPAWLSNGEFVVNAKATRENLGLLSAINGRTHAQKFADGGLAGRRHFDDRRYASSGGGHAPQPVSLAGLRIEGRVEINGMDGHLRGVIREELDADYRFDRVKAGG